VIRERLRQKKTHRDGVDRGHGVKGAAAETGLFRSRSVAPPPSTDGTVRIVEIVGLDRQACGGTRLGSTGRSRPIRILKIDNKGRHNRRVKYGLA